MTHVSCSTIDVKNASFNTDLVSHVATDMESQLLAFDVGCLPRGLQMGLPKP